MAGGKLVQDMNHRGSHELTFYDGFTMYTNTLHHQMAYPYNLIKGEDYYLIAAAYGLSDSFEDGYHKQMDMPIVNGKTEEPEMVFYPKINALGIQGHPEMMNENSTMVKVCRAFLDLQLAGVLEEVLQLGIGVDEIMARSEEFEFTPEEKAILASIKEEKHATAGITGDC